MKPRDGARSLLLGGSVLLGAAALASTAYLALLAGAARVGKHRGPRERQREHRIAVCVPAHNEAAVIEAAVRALSAQIYPADRLSIEVVADNCTDATAELADGLGANVHIRVAPDDPGKGPALNWLLDRLADTPYEIAVVVDADSIVEPDFASELNRSFTDGVLAVQGYYGVYQPEASAAVALRFAALASRHHLRPLGRTALGASCGLYGNGMAFRRSVVESRRWSGHLIEDAEYQLELLLEDQIVVRYAPTAQLFAEMPSSLEGAETQNERWELGRLQLAGRYLFPLLRRLGGGGTLRRRVYLDAIADLLTPPVSMIAGLQAAAFSLGLAAHVIRRGPASMRALVVPTLSMTMLGIHVIAALRAVQAPPAVYRALGETPRYIAWKLGVLAKVIARPDEISWVRTRRNVEEQHKY